MVESHDRENEERKSKRHDASSASPTEHKPLHETTPDYSPSLLGDPSLTERGNSTVHAAAIQRMQQTHGNRAVQRFLHSATPASRSVQRDIFDGLTVGDWKILPPTPKGETDNTYDDPESKRRAERQAEDERGFSPTPPEWWKPKPAPDLKAPPPWMPKVKIKEPPGEINIPPKGPDERGDYPLPPIPEDEGYG